MKKIVILFIVICLTLSTFTLISCGKKNPNNDDPIIPPDPPVKTETIEDTEITVDGDLFE